MGETIRPEPALAWSPFPGPQHALLHCPADEIFFGGARGGGKTDGMLGKFALKASRYGEDCIGVFFRRSREDLKEAIERSQAIYGPLGADYRDSKKQWTFPNGARLKFEYLDRDQDAQNYQGHNYTDLFFEELTNWPTPDPINKLRATLRSGAGVPCQFHATGNPGGPGHQWVKARYIDPCPNGGEFIDEEFENPFTGERSTVSRIFISSRLTNNPALMADPSYIARLQQSGSEQLVRAWLYGDWDVVEGAFFDNWEHDKHVIRPFSIPDHWLKFISGDWGYAAPFSFGWWAVASDDTETPSGIIPRGAMVRYREWYGAVSPNVGVRMPAEEVGRVLLERTGSEKLGIGVIDPAMFSSDGGPSIAERLALGSNNKLMFRRGDNRRIGTRGAMGGWDQMRSRLTGEEGRPMLYVFDGCKDSIRTIPSLQHDPDRMEDLDTKAEDHAADEWRYACMSRPYVKANPDEPKPKFDYKGRSDGTTYSNTPIIELIRRKERANRNV